MSPGWQLFFIFLTTLSTKGVQLKKSNVELVADGKKVRLQCPTEEHAASFHVVKWFKDGREFCRYYPQLNGKIRYNLNLIKSAEIRKRQIYCEETNVNLGEVSWTNDGLYTCQVFAIKMDHPKVITRSVSLLVYPRTGPVISGLKDSYEEGEVVQANCTAAPSNPPPSMIWYINGVSADGWSMFTYPCSVTKEGLCVLKLGLRLQAKRSTFPNGRASFVCEAGILALPPRRAFVTSKLVGLKSGGGTNGGIQEVIGVLVWCKIICLLN